MEAVQASALYWSLAAQHTGVEVWPDPDAPDASAAYFSVVSRFGEGNVRIFKRKGDGLERFGEGNVRILAYVRVRGGWLERRTYDEAGDDLWMLAE